MVVSPDRPDGRDCARRRDRGPAASGPGSPAAIPPLAQEGNTSSRSDRSAGAGNRSGLPVFPPAPGDRRGWRQGDRQMGTGPTRCKRNGAAQTRMTAAPAAEGRVVRAEGLEPPKLAPLEPKSSVSTSSTTPAHGTRFGAMRRPEGRRRTGRRVAGRLISSPPPARKPRAAMPRPDRAVSRHRPRARAAHRAARARDPRR